MQRFFCFLLSISCFFVPFLEAQPRSFEHVATVAIPAVVSIRVTLHPQENPCVAQNESYDFFNNEFWQRFLGGGNPQQPRPATGQGSGFIISPDGYIVTSGHVVRGGCDIRVELEDGCTYPATIVGEDRATDLAVLKIAATELPYLTLAKAHDLRIGEWVAAIGNPLGFRASLTVGVVSATGRCGFYLNTIEDFIQTDAAINRGNSGGPLLNLDGCVVGVNTALASTTGGCMGIGFAIPSAIVAHVVEELVSHSAVSRGFLGVTLQNIDHDLAAAFCLPRAYGALVTDISENSPAHYAGLCAGDVLVEINGCVVQGVHTVQKVVTIMNPGSDVVLTVYRQGRNHTVRVAVGEHPRHCVAEYCAPRVGFEVEELTSELADRLGYTLDRGVVIHRVENGSAAEEAGLAPGQLVVAINQRPVVTPEDFHYEIEGNSGERALLLVKQGHCSRFVTLPIR